MQAAGIHHLELTLLLLVLLVAGLTTLAQRFKIPYPIVLFIGGVVLSLLPHLPRIALNPDVVFLVVLPPLLYHRRLQHFMARLPQQSGQHSYAGLWPGWVYGAWALRWAQAG